MKPLIRITTEPIEIVRYSQNARLISSGSVDIERKKALARSSMQRRRASQVQSVSIEDVTRINRAFSKNNNVKSQVQDTSQNQVAYRRAAQPSVPTPAPSKAPEAIMADSDNASVAAAAIPASSFQPASDISMESNTSYVTQRGSFEMRVAKGELTYLPPMVMTFVTQRPQVHVEYLGGFNYVPPRDGDMGSSVNLFT